MGALKHIVALWGRLQRHHEETPDEALARQIETGKDVAQMLMSPGYAKWREEIEDTIARDVQRLLEMPKAEFITKGADDLRPKILGFQTALGVASHMIQRGLRAEERQLQLQKKARQVRPSGV